MRSHHRPAKNLTAFLASRCKLLACFAKNLRYYAKL